MIAIDTNVLVRLLVGDVAAQENAALRAVQAADGVLLLDTVLLETVWVLQSLYGAGRQEVCDSLQRVLTLGTPQTAMAQQALQWFAEGMDFADALHLAGAAAGRCQALLSFDARFARAAKGRTACAVVRPR